MVALKKKSSARTTYRDAGVDIRLADDFIRTIGPIADATIAERSGPMEGIGGFGALFDLKRAGFRDPILVSSTDGVGTKLRIAIETDQVDTIGIDLVAMCVNDVLVHGAEPLFFLNYFALGKLNNRLGERVLKGIAEGCRQAGVALVGGETAEMPGFYADGDFDLAGFTVGAVERGQELPRRQDICDGDILIGISSSGVHSNGYSLVRKLVERSGLKWSDSAPFEPSKTLGDALLEPTRIYVKPVLQVLKSTDGIKAFAHITGSGALGKLHRILPSPSANGVRAHIELGTWQVPTVFRWLRDQANYSDSYEDEKELLRAFNCGIGMVAVVAREKAKQILELLKASKEEAFVIGKIENHGEPSGHWPKVEDAVRLTGNLSFE
ncbi:MAG: phosphoribosylformylglycinamidine cyclo-ligase [Nitrobacter sp.]|uniref:phosphoribosylformylglycinamidine cyclo-ligase n=1 Tax=Nitrobacter sp. TaxID=29420 RepID=UPI00387DED02